ncbi:kinase-like protein [Exidia glandulosa HHB12029]|uniref:Kinase-like protein n=1 Tax=Exidia glandulosa HHB12029 TaxID=1314781 RepID=A0A165L4X1_EXIGL|nr:kinase-like protein [Exidia glandulosa HHB12029]
MVIPWAENGSLRWYLKRKPDADRHSLLREVAGAVAYLHARTPPVVHGDLHVDNVLISAQEHVQLSDFGLSRVLEDTSRSASVVGIGILAYQAPELHDDHLPTMPSDVFAFGMLIVETYSGARPLSRHRGTGVVIAIMNHERPARDEITRSDFPEQLWQLAEECWAHDQCLRPNATVVYQRL